MAMYGTAPADLMLCLVLPFDQTRSLLPIPKTITHAESHIIKARLRHRFTFNVTTNIPSIKNSIQMVPQHLWDHASKTFITDGYEAFTGIIKVVTSGMWQKSSGQIDNVTVSSFLVFGFAGGNFAVANRDNKTQKPLVPWAGIFLSNVENDPLLLFNSKDSEQWMPHVMHTVRETILARFNEGRPAPKICELGVFFVNFVAPRAISQVERAIRVVSFDGNEGDLKTTAYMS